MSKRYYYTDAIVALYMMKEFGVEFYTKGFLDVESNFLEKELGFHLEIRTLYNKLCQVNSKIYVASESEHIFKPRNYDLAGFTRDDGISTIAQYDEAKKAFINGSFRILKKYNPKIIIRDNKQFFMPEVEND
jgi:hypothetical protein